MSKTQTQPRRVQGFESFRELGSDFKKVIKNDIDESWKATWQQILGGEDTSQSSEFSVKDPFLDKLDKNEVFNASKHQTQKSTELKHIEKAQSRAEAAMDYHRDFIKGNERASKQDMREMNQRLQDIMAELQRLVSSSKVLQMEFAGVSVDQAPEQAGEYHLNFFDWLLITIRTARQKVEDSGAWLATTKKKSKKGSGYWDMFKKHGTTFGLSNERNVSTQTG